MQWRNRAAALVGVVALLAGIGLPLIATEASATAPPTALSPPQGSTVNNGTAIRATYNTTLNPSPGASSIHVFHNGTEVPGSSSTADFGGTGNTIVWTKGSGVTLEDGAYTAHATAQDISGSPPVTTDWGWTFDSTAPGLDQSKTSWPATIGPGNVKDAHVVGAIGATEAGAAIEVRWTDVVLQNVVADGVADASGHFDVAADLTKLQNGSLELNVSATDEASNQSSFDQKNAATKSSGQTGPSIHIGDDPITAANQTAVHLTGCAPTGSTVNISIDDSDTTTAPVTKSVVADGTSCGTNLSNLHGDTITADVHTLADEATTPSSVPGQPPTGGIHAQASFTNGAGTSQTTDSNHVTKDTHIPQAVSTSPADSTTAHSPSSVSVTFDESIAPDQTKSSMTVSKTGSNAHQVQGSISYESATSGGSDTKVMRFTPNPGSDSPLPDGTYTANWTVQDLNTNPNSGSFSFTSSAAAHTAPIIDNVETANASNVTHVHVSGSGDPGDTITITATDPGDAVTGLNKRNATGTSTVGSDRRYTVSIDESNLRDGTITYTSSAQDTGGNSVAGDATNGTKTGEKDTVPPGDPTITSFDNANTTNVTAVHLKGSRAASTDILHITVDDTDSSTAPIVLTASPDGNTAYDITLDLSHLSDGTVNATVSASDTAGNSDPTPATKSATKDTTVPTVVSSSPAPGGSTNNTSTVSITFSEPLDGSTSSITVKDKTGTTVPGAGSLSSDKQTLTYTTSSPMTESGSPYSASASVQDVNGNPNTTQFSFTVDTTPPQAPGITSITDPITTSNSHSVQAKGVSENGTTVRLTLDDDSSATGPVTASTTTDGSGHWAMTLDASSLHNGTLTATVVAQDAAGNTSPSSSATTTKSSAGYWLVATDGGLFTHGDAGFFGSQGATPLNKPIVGMAATPSGQGYWLVATDGGIFTHGDAGFFGSEGAKPLNKPIVGMAATPDGKGYWLVASDGGIFTHGDAGFFGSEGGHPLNKPIVGMVPTPSGKGYWLVATDGGIFTHGDAGFFGSEGGHPLNKPVVGMAATPDGAGYWLVATDGGMFTHGDAGFFGSEGGAPLNKPVVGMSPTSTGKGYWLVATDGGIFTHGDAVFAGSQGGSPLNKPIVGMAGFGSA